MSPKVRQPGQPRLSRAATTIEASAKGKAKTVWLRRTKEAHFWIVENIGPDVTRVPRSTAEPISAKVPFDPERGRRPCPPVARWFVDARRRMDWREVSRRQPAAKVRSFAHEQGSKEFRAAPK